MNPVGYHGSSELKARFVGHVKRHAAEDRFLQGTYGIDRGDGKGWRGCAVACSLRSLDEIDGRELSETNQDHAELAERLGIPLELARLEDGIFEGLARDIALVWPTRFAEAIPEGRDLAMVWPKLAHWLLVDEADGVLRLARTEAAKKAIAGVAELYRRWIVGEKPSAEEWRKARAAATATAATAAAVGAYATADAAVGAYAAATADADAARKLHWSKIADKLIELMVAA